MDLDDDKKKLYEVQELQEFAEVMADLEQSDKMKSAVYKDNQANKWKIGNTAFAILAILLLVILLSIILLVILQSIAIAHLNLLPVVCPEEATTTPTQSSAGTADTLADHGADQCCESQDAFNTQILSQISEIVNISQNTLSISDKHFSFSQNKTYSAQLSETTHKLMQIANTLSSVKDSNVIIDAAVNEILLLADELLKIHNDTDVTYSFTSCEDLISQQPNTQSGYYNINNQLTYCQIGELCGSSGGWTRIAYLDMDDSANSCPSGLVQYESSGVRSCGRPSTNGGSCASVKFPSNNVSYTEICGRVVGYQYFSPAAVATAIPNPNSIESYYVDGVSITQGSPRKHVWTLMAGLFDSMPHYANCPCNNPPGSLQKIPSFVGDDYFCESGSSDSNVNKLHVDDPLWDGKGCGSQEAKCCAASGLPWFHKIFTSSSDFLELRVCCDEGTSNEDSPVGFYEIFVK